MDTATLDCYVGKYSIASIRILTITRDGDQLNAQVSGQPQLPIYPETPPKFRWRVVSAQVTFDIENGRPATSATIHQSGVDIVATRLDEAAALTIEEKLANRITQQLPQPGSAAAVERFFEAVQERSPSYDDMTETLQVLVRHQLPVIAARAQEIQSIEFKGVSGSGADDYIVTYKDGQQSHCLVDLDSDGKIAMLALLPRFSFL